MTACGFPRPPDVPDDGSAFGLISTEPAAHAGSVDPSTTIRVTFSSTVGTTVPQFTVTAAAGDVLGNVTIDGATLTFHPGAPLATGTPFTVTVDGVSDQAGHRLATPVQFDFTTKTTLCVKPGGGDGCHARPSLAIAAANNGDSIAILEGDYTDNIAIDKSVTLLGGFGAMFTTRDPGSHVTNLRPAMAGTLSIPIIGITSGTSVIDGVSVLDGKNSDHGGGIRIDGGTVRVQNSVIARNNAFFTGGGLYIHGNATVQLIGNVIEDNVVGGQDNCSGAGVTVETSTVIMRNNTIQRNRILQNMGSGAGVFTTGAVATLINNRIEANHAADQGQVGTGGGIASFTSELTITGGTISRNDIGNTTGTGAGLDLNGGTVRLDGVRIEGNATGMSTGGGAGAIHAANTKLIIASSIIASNTGATGAIAAGPQGATVIVNSTIADNTARGVITGVFLTVVNTAMLRNGVAIELAQPPPAVSIRQNAFFGNTTNLVGGTLDTSNLTADPLIDATFHLMANSPLIDVGLSGPIATADFTAPPVDPPSKDIDGDSRAITGKLGPTPDIGADEFRPST